MINALKTKKTSKDVSIERLAYVGHRGRQSAL